MKYKCPFQVRTHDASIHCAKIDNGKGWCGHQYYCRLTEQWENTRGSIDCPMKNKKEK